MRSDDVCVTHDANQVYHQSFLNANVVVRIIIGHKAMSNNKWRLKNDEERSEWMPVTSDICSPLNRPSRKILQVAGFWWRHLSLMIATSNNFHEDAPNFVTNRSRLRHTPFSVRSSSDGASVYLKSANWKTWSAWKIISEFGNNNQCLNDEFPLNSPE